MLRQHLFFKSLLFLLMIALPAIQSCCKKRVLAVQAELQLEGFDLGAPIYVIRTPASNINTHLDTTIRKVPSPSYLLTIRFGWPDEDYETYNYIIYPDTFDVSYSITDIDVKYETLCKGDAKSYTYKINGEEKTGRDDPIIITK